MTIALNDAVEVTLTEAGAAVFASHWSGLPVRLRPTVGAGQQLECSMWYLMTIFGPHIKSTGPAMFEPNEIRVTKETA